MPQNIVNNLEFAKNYISLDLNIPKGNYELLSYSVKGIKESKVDNRNTEMIEKGNYLYSLKFKEAKKIEIFI
jgi:hypothetical protein